MDSTASSFQSTTPFDSSVDSTTSPNSTTSEEGTTSTDLETSRSSYFPSSADSSSSRSSMEPSISSTMISPSVDSSSSTVSSSGMEDDGISIVVVVIVVGLILAAILATCCFFFFFVLKRKEPPVQDLEEQIPRVNESDSLYEISIPRASLVPFTRQLTPWGVQNPVTIRDDEAEELPEDSGRNPYALDQTDLHEFSLERFLRDIQDIPPSTISGSFRLPRL
ncbi:uncharacterized protein LOC125026777 [Penaeus chinensis]|uniref:uncharacterized protein LOC125026777 n=1 Tax=Penaeus chinensis TaxID=139456 RepID=UPI001FB601DE|nr:uncharacterized protein LOC125026777 [Penaeus chinensis]